MLHKYFNMCILERKKERKEGRNNARKATIRQLNSS